jgi:hypothetical protein
MPENVRTFRPGFRFTKLDAIFLLVGLYISADTAAVHPWLGIAIGFVIVHFFLFCNLVRMARPFELAWSALFLVLASSTVFAGSPPWPVTMAISFAVTVVLIGLETRKPSYHGVFWSQINPELPQWWQDQA